MSIQSEQAKFPTARRLERGEAQSQPSPVMPLLIPAGGILPEAHRLVVLIPDGDVDEAGLARRIWTLASPRQLQVLYLGICHTLAREPMARRRLATLAALTRDDGVATRTQVVMEDDWLLALRPRMAAGDLIVCHSEQTRGFREPARSLAETLNRALQAPVYVLEGFLPTSPPDAAWHAPLVFWAGAAVIVAGAFWLQVSIAGLGRNGGETVLMMLSVAGEFSLIALWNRMFS